MSLLFTLGLLACNGEDPEDTEDGDEDGRPARETASLEPRDDRIQTQRQEEGRADVEQDRREGLDAGDEQEPQTHPEGGDQRHAERIVDLHRRAPSLG